MREEEDAAVRAFLETVIWSRYAALIGLALCGCYPSAVEPADESAVITSLAISPDSATLDPQSDIQLNATATYSNGTQADVSARVAWNSDDEGTATVGPSGLLSGVAPGLATVSARLGDVASSARMKVMPSAMISITFDDGKSSQLAAADILSTYRMRGTFYVVKHWVANAFTGCMSTGDVQRLAQAGHEIGSHTVYHRHLPTMTDGEVESELEDSQAWLRTNIPGAEIQSFASPFGEYDDRVLSIVRATYGSHRTTRSHLNFTQTPLDELGDYGATTEPDVERWIEEAISQKAWLIVSFHEFALDANAQAGFPIPEFVAILEYISRRPIRVVTVAEGTAEMRRVQGLPRVATPAP